MAGKAKLCTVKISGTTMSAEEGSPPMMPKNNEPENIEHDNAKGGNIWVNLNDSGNNKQSEMIETIRSLKA